MRPHRTYSLTQPDTHLCINDYSNSGDQLTPIQRELRAPTAILALAFGLGLALLVMLGTWLSLSTQAPARITTFVAHPQEPMLQANELEDRDFTPADLDDVLLRF